MSGLLAIVNAAPADYEALAASIAAADGAAQSLADTMQDNPVSYTHLDVYKRQTPHRSMMICGILASRSGMAAMRPSARFMMRFIPAVSYTHLDVYKRQFQRLQEVHQY